MHDHSGAEQASANSWPTDQRDSSSEGYDLLWILLIAGILFVVLLLCPSEAASTSAGVQKSRVDDALSSQPLGCASAVLHALTAATFPAAVYPLPVVRMERTGEGETRAALSRIFGKPFIKVRPAFLVNPETKRRLELDCYNEELRLGVEYNGIQHDVFPNPFHHTRDLFDAQQRRDRYKIQQCRQAGVRLVVVPHTVPREQIEQFLRQKLCV
jgi:hypothetical protein